MNEQKMTVTLTQVAAELGMNTMFVKEMIRTGQLPIGVVFKPQGSNQERTIIPRKRWEAWRDGHDIAKGG